MPPHPLHTAMALLLSTTATIAQNDAGGAIDCPSAVTAGGTITITVGPNDTTLDIKQIDGSTLATLPATPGKSITIPVPHVPSGSALVIRLGDAQRKRAKVVEILQPSP